jgi:hypothetical protein
VKGISQILGSTFLLAIGITVAGIYSTFAGDFAQGTGSEIADETRSEIKCGSASLDVRRPTYTAADTARFDIVNTGTVDLRGVSAFAINDTSEIINGTEIDRLSVSETRSVVLRAQTPPKFVTAAIDECPGLRPREEL